MSPYDPPGGPAAADETHASPRDPAGAPPPAPGLEEGAAAAPVAARAIRSGYWAFGLRGLEWSVRVGRTLVLARLLAPDDFGLFGMAALALAVLERLSQTGVRAALIQQRDHTREELDTAWTIQVGRGVILGVALFAAAPLVGRFFDALDLVPLLRVLSLVPLLEGLTNVGVVRFEWGLEFHRRFWYRASGAFAEALVGIVWAVLVASPWALVAGFVAGSLVRAAASYRAHPFRPRVRLSLPAARSLLSYGRWFFWSELMVFLVTQGDDLLVALWLGPTAVGLYQMAYMLASLPTTQVTHVVGEVAFPSYARMRDSRRKLRLTYERILFGTTLVTFPVSVAIMVFAEEGVRVLLGPTWLAAVPALQVLAVLGGLRSFGATNGALFHGVGRPELNTWVTAIHLALMAAVIAPLVGAWGIFGAAVAVTAPMLVSQAVGSWLAARVTGSSRPVVNGVGAPLAGACAMAVVAVSTRALIGNEVVRLAVGLPTGAAAHLAVVRWLAPRGLVRFRRLFSA